MSVQVNGETKNLPVLLNRGHVSVYTSGSRVIVTTDFGLSVTYDGSSTVFISVPSNYRYLPLTLSKISIIFLVHDTKCTWLSLIQWKNMWALWKLQWKFKWWVPHTIWSHGHHSPRIWDSLEGRRQLHLQWWMWLLLPPVYQWATCSGPMWSDSSCQWAL